MLTKKSFEAAEVKSAIQRVREDEEYRAKVVAEFAEGKRRHALEQRNEARRKKKREVIVFGVVLIVLYLGPILSASVALSFAIEGKSAYVHVAWWVIVWAASWGWQRKLLQLRDEYKPMEAWSDDDPI